MDKETLAKLRIKLPTGWADIVAKNLKINRRTVDRNMFGITKKINQKILAEVVKMAKENEDLHDQAKELANK